MPYSTHRAGIAATASRSCCISRASAWCSSVARICGGREAGSRIRRAPSRQRVPTARAAGIARRANRAKRPRRSGARGARAARHGLGRLGLECLEQMPCPGPRLARLWGDHLRILPRGRDRAQAMCWLSPDRSSRDAALSGAAAEVSRVGLARRRQVVHPTNGRLGSRRKDARGGRVCGETGSSWSEPRCG